MANIARGRRDIDTELTGGNLGPGTCSAQVAYQQIASGWLGDLLRSQFRLDLDFAERINRVDTPSLPFGDH